MSTSQGVYFCPFLFSLLKKKTTQTNESTSTEYQKSTPCYGTEGQIRDTQQSERRQKDMLPPLVEQSHCAFERHLSSLLGSLSC